MRSKIRTLFDSIFLNIFWVLTSDNLQSEWSVFKALCNEVLKTYAGSSLIYGLGHVQDCVCIVFSLTHVLSYVQEWLLLCKAIFRISSAYVYRTLHGNRVKKNRYYLPHAHQEQNLFCDANLEQLKCLWSSLFAIYLTSVLKNRKNP